ncbi:DUF488 domain-containing protein [Caulobacter endophyticus]|uniref:DUF488 domain-containing protein n=1 Tax=Caulobacter endophyticus TaxID=2172652 RepID=UPI00240F31A3|nr:DUF488 domain-containing protein [Caulobacter endophyticus]MDG2527179.1 DUF488 domain-containing protein [Caulobacter endophyticus]
MATIGFTQTSAKSFFERLKAAGVRTVIDVRLHNTSQLAGFAKSDDLSYFLKAIDGIVYRHEPLLAPTDQILKAFKKDKGDWRVFETSFMALMAGRKIEDRLKLATFEEGCLLCSEATPHNCHRRLVCEYLNGKWGGALEVRHL